MSSASKSQSKTDPEAVKGRLGMRRTVDRVEPQGDVPPLDLRDVINSALIVRWRRLAAQSKRARSNPGEKTIHDLRVAMRRMIALLDLVKTILPKSGAAGIRKRLKMQLGSLSSLRDAQVQILQVEGLFRKHPVLSGFLGNLRARESNRRKHTKKEIERIDLISMQDYFNELKTKLDEFLSDPVLREAAHSILWGMLAKIFAQTVVLRSDIKNDEDGRIPKIHELRLLFKRFRYIVEVLQPVLPGVSDQLLERMSSYQAGMGCIQDTEVLISSFSSYSKRVRKKARRTDSGGIDPLDSLHDHLAELLMEETNSFCMIMDELDEYWERIK